MKLRIYIACPYTKGNVEKNVADCLGAAEVLSKWYIPFAPLLFHYWDKAYPHAYDFWIEQSMEWLKCCDVVVRLPGESHGADMEVNYALATGRTVFYSTTEALQWLHKSLPVDQPTHE